MLLAPLFSALLVLRLIEGLDKEFWSEPGVGCIEHCGPILGHCAASDHELLWGHCGKTNGSSVYGWDLFGVIFLLYPVITAHSTIDCCQSSDCPSFRVAQLDGPWLQIHMHDVTAHHQYQYHNTNMTPLTKYELPAFWYLCIHTFIPYSNELRCLEPHGKNR